MNVDAFLNGGFVQIALPIMFTILIAAWIQNKRFDDMNKRFDDMNRRFDEMSRRFDKIDQLLLAHD